MDPDTWPRDEDAPAIALASRIVLLSAVAGTCPISGRTYDQGTLLQQIERATQSEMVEGRTFSEFLAWAQGDVHGVRLKKPADAADTLAAISASEPVDFIGEIYQALVVRVSEAYECVGQTLAPPRLHRKVRNGGAALPFQVSGKVPSNRGVVMLNLYPAFDLEALALLPYVLAHELVCHVGARHVGEWKLPLDPDVKEYFSEGFMDRAAWFLLMQWSGADELPTVTPIGHLAEVELPYAIARPGPFRAGRAAWENCTKVVASRLLDASVRGRTTTMGAMLDVALALNASDTDICGKDVFVALARDPQSAVMGHFGDVALGEIDPPSFFSKVRTPA
jgi:hypothetical protein